MQYQQPTTNNSQFAGQVLSCESSLLQLELAVDRAFARAGLSAAPSKKSQILLHGVILTVLCASGLHAQSDRLSGRLIDLSCGSVSARNPARLTVIHSVEHLKQSPGKLAIVTDDRMEVIRLTAEQEKTAGKWRADLAAGEVYIHIDEAGHIHRSLLPWQGR